MSKSLDQIQDQPCWQSEIMTVVTREKKRQEKKESCCCRNAKELRGYTVLKRDRSFGNNETTVFS